MVHVEEMHETEEEKYLGDQINKSAKHASTIAKRRGKGFGIISDITQILDVIPDGTRRIRMGLLLREALFVNAMFVNMEAWHNVLQKDTSVFTKLDQYLMRKIVGCHSKVPIEMLYLETNTIPLDFILASRRINYLHNIVSKTDDELTKRVYEQQKKDPCKGDWCELVEKDMDMVNLDMDKNSIKDMPKQDFKNHVRKFVRSAAFSTLKDVQSSHTKVKNISYPKFSLQPYLASDTFSSEESSLLFNMRADTVNAFKMCFPSAHRNDNLCKLGCGVEDSISHAFSCQVLSMHGGSQGCVYVDIFANITQQKQAVSTFMQLQNIRSTLLLSDTAYQGHILDTASSASPGEAGEARRTQSS